MAQAQSGLYQVLWELSWSLFSGAQILGWAVTPRPLIPDPPAARQFSNAAFSGFP